MKLKCVSTGSDANTYILESFSGEKLILDLGASEKEIKIACGFDVKNIVGACVTHTHHDHYRSVKNFEKIGIPVFKPYESGEHIQVIKKQFGEYSVVAFALDDVAKEKWQHTNGDGSECPIYGFKIDHPELGNSLIYVTDAKLIKYRFKNISYLLLGVDYQDDLIDKDSSKALHVLTGHMSIDTACEFIRVTGENGELVEVILGHLSQDSAEDEYFINKVNKVSNFDVQIAKKGMEVELSLVPF